MKLLNRKPREIGRLRTEYSPPEAKAAAAMIEHLRDIKEWDSPFVAGPSRLSEQETERPCEIDSLDELAVILRRLTYGQMLEFCEGVKKDEPKDVLKWAEEWSTK
jgi:hypothetical protein